MGKQSKAPVSAGEEGDRVSIAPPKSALHSTVPASGPGGSDAQPSELDSLTRLRGARGKSGTQAAVTEEARARHQRREICDTLPAPPDPDAEHDVDPLSGPRSQ